MEATEKEFEKLEVVGGEVSNAHEVEDDLLKDAGRVVKTRQLLNISDDGDNVTRDGCEHSGDEKHHDSANSDSEEQAAPQDHPQDHFSHSEQSSEDDSEKDDDSDSDSDDGKSDCEWDDEEPPPLDLNYDALKHIVKYFLPGDHGACTDIEKLRRGAFHEVRVLHFEDGWSCIARFTRDVEALQKTQSELATMEYVRKHTKIPVPEVFYINHNRNHVVGAAFVLMERMEGELLRNIYWKLSSEHKFSIIGQIANVVGQLSDLHFDKIGSLTAEGAIGPCLNLTRGMDVELEGPFATTMEYFRGALNENRPSLPENSRRIFPEIIGELETIMAEQASNPTFNAPFRLIHDDFELWNMLVAPATPNSPPKITSIIDWDWAYTGPLHYLYDYPAVLLFYQNTDEDRVESKALRKHFVKTLMHRYPKGSVDRENVKRCFREKSHVFNGFQNTFAGWDTDDPDEDFKLTSTFLSDIRREDSAEFYNPHGIFEKWVPDSDPESDDE